MSLSPVDAVDLLRRLDEFDAVIDARSEDEYALDHLPGEAGPKGDAEQAAARGAGVGAAGPDHHAHYRAVHPPGHVDEHRLEVGGANPELCTPNHDCHAHADDHTHGPGCGHEAVPHGDHIDYLVDGHLHHPHEVHCDDHGPVSVI